MSSSSPSDGPCARSSSSGPSTRPRFFGIDVLEGEPNLKLSGRRNQSSEIAAGLEFYSTSSEVDISGLADKLMDVGVPSYAVECDSGPVVLQGSECVTQVGRLGCNTHPHCFDIVTIACLKA